MSDPGDETPDCCEWSDPDPHTGICRSCAKSAGGDETPEASGCANDCVHPDHQHGDLFVLAPAEAAAKFKIIGPIVRHRSTLAALFADDTADTHDEWIRLNEGLPK